MASAFFYIDEIGSAGSVVLNEETSKHVVQVLRMQNGDQLKLTDGKGSLHEARITDNHKRTCTVEILKTTRHERTTKVNTVAISLVKNAHRFEWFLEKATEIGITEIIPIICARTEKQHFRHSRLHTVLISAMLQSEQTWLPVLHEPQKLNDVINRAAQNQKFIAHCDESDKTPLVSQINNASTSSIILIGPEGDFTKEEIEQALQHDFIPVSLGDTRLRTETAGVVAATVFSIL
jgi:16S rRNA (uracil1498-N3)-methyltransferase